jgi:hypothetical protein
VVAFSGTTFMSSFLKIEESLLIVAFCNEPHRVITFCSTEDGEKASLCKLYIYLDRFSLLKKGIGISYYCAMCHIFLCKF